MTELALDRAVAWFLEGWSSEGPRVPTPDTVRTYRWHLQWFSRFAKQHGKLDVADALQADFVRSALRWHLDEARQHSAAHKGGESTAAGMIQALRKLAGWLLAQGVPVSTLSAIRVPRAPERTQPRLLPDEFAALKQAVLDHMLAGSHANPAIRVARDLALLYFLADTGLRASEVVGMTIDDIDFDRGRVIVRRGKGRKARVLSIADPSDLSGGTTLRLLAEWIKVRESVRHTDRHTRLWVSVPRGLPLSRSTLRAVLHDLCIAAGLDGNRPPHAFRRAHFTEQYRASPESIKVLSARMGWSPKSHQMANVYTRGADLDFASEVVVPSMASQWGGAVPAMPVAVARRPVVPSRPTPRAPRSRSAGRDRKALLEALRADPELRRELLQALLADGTQPL